MALRERYTYICSILILSISCTSGLSCNAGLQISDGYTIPQGDIVLQYGQPLNITCNINKSLVTEFGENASSRLYFTKSNSSDVLPSSMITVLNSTSIELYVANHTTVDSVNYYCWFCYGSMENITEEKQKPKSCQSKNICFNVVSVGVPPQDITDFSCLSRNYQNLTCTWTAKNNYVKTDYNLTYHLQVRASRPNRKHKRPDMIESNYPFTYNCSNMTKTVDKITKEKKYSCFWDVHTASQYRQSHDMFYFTLRMLNVFGNKTNRFVFDHFSRVLPNPPENLTAVATSPHSIRLSWAISNEMSNFQTGLRHRILYQSEYEYDKWKFEAILVDPDKTIEKTHTYEMKGLKYANALYDIRVSMKSKAADEDDEEMWSKYSAVTVRTKSKIPDCAPKTTQGSFDIGVARDGKHDVSVYWQQLKYEQRNGQHFYYHVEVQNNPSINYPKVTRTGVTFRDMPDLDYVINIWSVNEVGRSLNKSTVVIPAQRLREPAHFMKVEHYKDNKQINELTWDPPIESEALITNYTIFWCNSDMQRHCVDDFNWVTVPRDVRKYNHTLPKKNSHLIAISANSLNSTSGMRLAACTVNLNNRMGKIRYVNVKNVESDFIELAWTLDCTNQKDPIDGFVIYYCRIHSTVNSNCIEKEEHLDIKGGVWTRSAKVGGLKPYSSYRLSVAFKFNSTISEPSDPVYNVTKEGSPTVPQNITVYKITNSSISLQWQAPLITNGRISRYNVSYNGASKNVNPNEDSPINEVTLTDLMSYTTYSIRVQACTVPCSKDSAPLYVTTKMWEPGKISKPDDSIINSTHVTLKWDKPSPPRGKVDYYIVKISIDDGLPERYENVTSQNITIIRCKEKYKAPSIAVRGVNIIDGEHKVGPWSEERKVFCEDHNSTLNASIVYILVGVAILVFAIFMGCCFKRLYKCYNDFRKVEVRLPPGLHQKVNTTENTKSTSINKIGADEELLLNKMMKDVRSSGDSSGCSSGHESITSSLESTTHISPSDSGTEQPRSPSLGEEKNSLRQRKVPTTMRPTIDKGYVLPDAVQMTNRPLKPSPVTGGNYCVLGVDPTSQTETGSPYVPITDVTTKMPFSDDTEQPPPYVVTGDFIKTPNPGYVPYNVTEPASKNTGYVVAGLTKNLVTPDLLQCDATSKPAVVEGKPLYVKASETLPNIKGVQFPWQQPPVENTLPE